MWETEMGSELASGCLESQAASCLRILRIFFGTSKSTPLVLQLRKLGPGTKVAESRSHCLGSSLQWTRLWLKKHTPVLHVLMGLLQAQAVVGKVEMDLCPRVDSCWQLREGPG